MILLIFAAILAGGIGQRLNSESPKQFLTVGNKPILIHSIEKFLEVDDFNKIIISSPKDFIDYTKELVEKYFPENDKLVVIEGGAQRKDTINNSIDYAIECGADEDSVMVTHDAARIFASPSLIKKSIDYAIEYGAASPVIPATDVIFKCITPNKLDSVPLRKELLHSQTPQSFNIFKYKKIYDDLNEEEIEKLDEAMVLFNLRGEDVYLFEGEQSNFKITRPFDLELAEFILNR